jgi:fructose-bisphosphate aldolase class II
VHGVFTSKPDIDFERITNIRKQIETPLVLHGCSGLSDDDFKKAIQNGITKLNYYTDLVLEAARKAKEIINGEGETNYLELNRNIMIAIKNMIMRKMDVFGSSGKG